MKSLFKITILLVVALLLAVNAGAHDEKPVIIDELGPIVPGTGFEGRVVIDGAVLPGAKVYAYRSFADFIASKPYASSDVTGDDGKYLMDLPNQAIFLRTYLLTFQLNFFHQKT